MSAELTPQQATQDVTAALAARGAEVGGQVRVESRRVSMPRTFGEAILTTVTPAEPYVDLPLVAAIVKCLPGVLTSARDNGKVFAYRQVTPPGAAGQ
jgi:hypothetical protein